MSSVTIPAGIDVHESSLFREMLMVHNSTDTAHIVDEDGESACGRFEFALDEIYHDGEHVYYYTRYSFGGTGLIHEDDDWRPTTKSLCHYCDQHVPDELQQELFTDEKFTLVEELTDGHQ